MTLKTIVLQIKMEINFAIFFVFLLPSLINYRSNMTILLSSMMLKEIAVTKSNISRVPYDLTGFGTGFSQKNNLNWFFIFEVFL